MSKAVAFVFFFSLFGIPWVPVAVYADYSPSLNNWMRNLDDDLRITDLTIPGTHDSAADHDHCEKNSACKAVIEFASTQTYDIQEQMKRGVRFFDVRLAYKDGAFEFHHGPYDLKQSLEEAIDWADDFLTANPSECLIWLIKQESTKVHPDDFWLPLSNILSSHPAFYLEKNILTVGEARGKVIVMARAESSYPQGYCVGWTKNTEYYEGSDQQRSDHYLTYVAEDHYSLATVHTSTKFMDIRRNLFLARSCVGCGSSEALFFTFLSGEGDSLVKGPAHYADYENPHTVDWLMDNPPGEPRSGIIAMDFAGNSDHSGDQMVYAAIGQNHPHKAPSSFGTENAGGGIIATDIDGNGELDLVVMSIYAPSGANTGEYRIGWDLDKYGQASNWSGHYNIPWQGNCQQGCGITATDVNGDGTPDLIVFMIDAPSGEDTGYYRVGYMQSDGTASKWTDFFKIPGWFGDNNDGGGITVTDINGNGKPDLVVFNIDDPSGANGGYYRIGWDLDKEGNIANWSGHYNIPWQGNYQQGGGITATDVNGDGTPDLIVFMIDAPDGPNTGYYRIGYMDSEGKVTKWGDFVADDWEWFGNVSQGAGITVADVDDNGKSDLILFFIDNPSGENQGYYRILWDEGSSKE